MEEIAVNESLNLSEENRGNLGFEFDKKIKISLLVLVVLGIGTGYFLYVKQSNGVLSLNSNSVEVVKTAKEEGLRDSTTFPDTATGILKENDGKITNEGTHVLIRGDVSQNAYLTSTVVDLSKYVDKNVQVWGQTFKGYKAGWLMDVGRIKIID